MQKSLIQRGFIERGAFHYTRSSRHATVAYELCLTLNTALTFYQTSYILKNAVFWDVAPCRFFVNASICSVE
jgi:hypothetical protein